MILATFYSSGTVTFSIDLLNIIHNGLASSVLQFLIISADKLSYPLLYEFLRSNIIFFISKLSVGLRKIEFGLFNGRKSLKLFDAVDIFLAKLEPILAKK